MGGRGRGGRRILANNGAGTLNDRFSQYKAKGESPASRGVRRNVTAARGQGQRSASIMEKRTGRRPAPQQQVKRGGFQTRRPVGNRGGGLRRGAARGRGGNRGTRGRGGRGGRGKGKPQSAESLDADLDQYMGRSELVQQQRLDEDLESYMANRGSAAAEEKKSE